MAWTARWRELNNFLFRVSRGFEICNELIDGLLNDIENSSACLICVSPQSPHLLLIESVERETTVQEELHEIGGCLHRLTSKAKALYAQENSFGPTCDLHQASSRASLARLSNKGVVSIQRQRGNYHESVMKSWCLIALIQKKGAEPAGFELMISSMPLRRFTN
jgi:hypothetical protein